MRSLTGSPQIAAQQKGLLMRHSLRRARELTCT